MGCHIREQEAVLPWVSVSPIGGWRWPAKTTPRVFWLVKTVARRELVSGHRPIVCQGIAAKAVAPRPPSVPTRLLCLELAAPKGDVTGQAQAIATWLTLPGRQLHHPT